MTSENNVLKALNFFNEIHILLKLIIEKYIYERV